LLAYSGRALSAPPTPSPPKNKKLAVDGGVNPAFEPECRTVLNQAESPGNEPEDVRPTFSLSKFGLWVFAIELRVMNPSLYRRPKSRFLPTQRWPAAAFPAQSGPAARAYALPRPFGSCIRRARIVRFGTPDA